MEQNSHNKEPSLLEIEGGTPDSGIGFDLVGKYLS